MFLLDHSLTLTPNDRCQLVIHWAAPAAFCTWSEADGFCLAWRRLLSLRRWARVMFDWQLRIDRRVGINHRCWCPVGSLIDCLVTVCGFTATLQFSHFTGEPCACDEIVESIEPEDGPLPWDDTDDDRPRLQGSC